MLVSNIITTVVYFIQCGNELRDRAEGCMTTGVLLNQDNRPGFLTHIHVESLTVVKLSNNI